MLDCLDSEYKPRKICVTMLRICVVQIKKYEKKKNETKSSGTDKNVDLSNASAIERPWRALGTIVQLRKCDGVLKNDAEDTTHGR